MNRDSEDEDDPIVFVPIALEDLDEEAQARASEWEQSQHWHWIDAVVWIATARSDLMALMSGYRSFRDRVHAPQYMVGEGACRHVALAHVPEVGIEKAERQLRAWCRDGVIEAISLATGKVVPVADWHGGREPVSGDMPFVLMPSAHFRGVTFNDPAPSIPTVVPKRRGSSPGPKLDKMASALRPIFLQHHDRISSATSGRQRHALVKAIWDSSMRHSGPAPAKNTVNRHWDSYLADAAVKDWP